MKRIFIFSTIILIILLSSSSFFMLDSAKKNVSNITNSKSVATSQKEKFTPYTAQFTIYTNGTKRDFSDPKYHNLTDNIFIEQLKPEEIKIRKMNVTWKDFFDTLPAPFMLTSTCLTTGTGQNFCITSTTNLVFYLNKIPTPDLLLRVINPNDSLIIVYGTSENLKDVLGDSASSPSSILNKK